MSKWSSAFRDSRWQKKRLEIMERDKWTCKSCGTTTKTLNVHHAFYESNKAPWEYENSTLITWCEDCHKERHEMMRIISMRFISLPMPSFEHSFSLLFSMESNFNQTFEALGE